MPGYIYKGSDRHNHKPLDRTAKSSSKSKRNLMHEDWRPFKYSEQVFISNYGRLKSYRSGKPYILTPNKVKVKGRDILYFSYQIENGECRRKSAHTVVAEHFFKDRWHEKASNVFPKDGDYTNLKIDNLFFRTKDGEIVEAESGDVPPFKRKEIFKKLPGEDGIYISNYGRVVSTRMWSDGHEIHRQTKRGRWVFTINRRRDGKLYGDTVPIMPLIAKIFFKDYSGESVYRFRTGNAMPSVDNIYFVKDGVRHSYRDGSHILTTAEAGAVDMTKLLGRDI